MDCDLSNKIDRIFDDLIQKTKDWYANLEQGFDTARKIGKESRDRAEVKQSVKKAPSRDYVI